MIKKILQNTFKSIFYTIFSKIYGKIENVININTDNRIVSKSIDIEGKFGYKIYKIKEGRLYTDRIADNAVILDKNIIEEPSFQFRYDSKGYVYNSKIDDNVVFKKGTPRILKKIKGNLFSLLVGGGGNDNYWHWLFNVLPKLNICSKNIDLEEIDYFLFPSLHRKFQNETLDFLNIPRRKRLSSEKYRHIKASELILTNDPVSIMGNATEDIQNIPDWIIQWLQNIFIQKKIVSNNKSIKRIYIDREKADQKKKDQRLISNEDTIRKILIENNFTPVKLHEKEFSEQVSLFNNAECIIGLHGAGFANTIFCKPGTKVIEFRNSILTPVIENLAKKNNLNYSCVSVEEKEMYFSHPTQQGVIEIPIKILEKILRD